MNIRACCLPLARVIVLLGVTACCRLYGGVGLSFVLGSGEPGLHIIYQATNRFVIYRDEPWTIGSRIIYGYETRHIEVLLDRNYGFQAKLQHRDWNDVPQQLFPFDDETAFACDGAVWDPTNQVMTGSAKTEVFSLKSGGLAVADDVYASARARYGLATNQWFLGKIRSNIYYWETPDPRKVFFRAATGEGTVSYFKLSSGIMETLGVTQAVRDKEKIGFVVRRKSGRFSHYGPSEYTVIAVSFKEAKQVKGGR